MATLALDMSCLDRPAAAPMAAMDMAGPSGLGLGLGPHAEFPMPNVRDVDTFEREVVEMVKVRQEHCVDERLPWSVVVLAFQRLPWAGERLSQARGVEALSLHGAKIAPTPQPPTPTYPSFAPRHSRATARPRWASSSSTA